MAAILMWPDGPGTTPDPNLNRQPASFEPGKAPVAPNPNAPEKEDPKENG